MSLSWQDIWKVQEQEENQTNPLLRALFLFESGKVVKAYNRLVNRKCDKVDGYLAELKIELGDFFAQLRFLLEVHKSPINFEGYRRCYQSLEHSDEPWDQLMNIMTRVSDVQQAALYYYLSGKEEYKIKMLGLTGDLISRTVGFCITMDLPVESTIESGKYRIKNKTLQVWVQENRIQ